MKSPFPLGLLTLASLMLAACGFEQSQPAPVADPDAWGQLEPDAARPQQAENRPVAGVPAAGKPEQRPA